MIRFHNKIKAKENIYVVVVSEKRQKTDKTKKKKTIKCLPFVETT